VTDHRDSAEERQRDICERIRRLCCTREWYGPDIERARPASPYEEHHLYMQPDSPAMSLEDMLHVFGVHLRGCPYEWRHEPKLNRYDVTIDRTNDPARRDFEYPPATEEQVRATEEALGLPLPPMLRLLYREVANGGFGPAYGITGVRGGWTYGRSGHDETLDQWRGWSAKGPHAHAISLADYDRDLLALFDADLPGHLIPAHLVPICNEGCGQADCVDLATGRIYLIGAGGGEDEYDNFSIYIRREAPSIEEWLDRWLREPGQ
jgi:hypothetical protein